MKARNILTEMPSSNTSTRKSLRRRHDNNPRIELRGHRQLGRVDGQAGCLPVGIQQRRARFGELVQRYLRAGKFGEEE